MITRATPRFIRLSLLLIGAPMLWGRDLGWGHMDRWAVLDFRTRAPLAVPEAGRYATGSVVSELSQISRYDVFSRQEAAQALKSLGLTPPLSAIGERRLGRQIGAVVTGDIRVATAPEKTPRVQVTLTIQVRDTHTGEMINGARGREFGVG